MTFRSAALPRLVACCRRFAGDARGTMAVETAIVAPVMILLAIGSFQVSSMVARKTELQGAAAEAAAIALAAPPEDSADLTPVKAVIMEATGLGEEEVTLSMAYRCDAEETRRASSAGCNPDRPIWTYMMVSLQDTYTPIWTRLGIGAPITLSVDRAVQVS